MRKFEDIYELAETIFFAAEYYNLTISETTENGKTYKAELEYKHIPFTDADIDWIENCKKYFLEYNIIIEFKDDEPNNKDYQILYFDKKDLQQMLIREKLK